MNFLATTVSNAVLVAALVGLKRLTWELAPDYGLNEKEKNCPDRDLNLEMQLGVVGIVKWNFPDFECSCQIAASASAKVGHPNHVTT